MADRTEKPTCDVASNDNGSLLVSNTAPLERDDTAGKPVGHGAGDTAGNSESGNDEHIKDTSTAEDPSASLGACEPPTVPATEEPQITQTDLLNNKLLTMFASHALDEKFLAAARGDGDDDWKSDSESPDDQVVDDDVDNEDEH
jgi:hypothetical protein